MPMKVMSMEFTLILGVPETLSKDRVEQIKNTIDERIKTFATKVVTEELEKIGGVKVFNQEITINDPKRN